MREHNDSDTAALPRHGTRARPHAMAAIEEVCLPPEGGIPELWRAVAERSRAWLHARGVPVREAVVLVPYAALLVPARAAFAAAASAASAGLGDWMPRVETALTLSQALAPPPLPEAGACVGEPLQDRLHAAEWLRAVPALAAAERSEAKVFAVMVQRLAETTGALRDAALCLPPNARANHWQRLRTLLEPPEGPGAIETALLALAVDWAEASSKVAATDALFTLRTGAWIAVQVAGAEALAEGLLAAAVAPALRIVTDAASDNPFAGTRPPALLERLVCDDAEAEAQAAAGEIIDALNRGRTPVALVALDRSVVRRVRALLERQQAELVDETGWRLASTVAGTRVAGLLRAAHPEADDDTRLAWLKGWPRADGEGLRSLEALWRGSRRVPNAGAAARLLELSERHLAPLREPGAAALSEWLVRLRGVLAAGGELAALLADQAGRQVIEALWLGEGGTPPAAAGAAARWRLGLAAFTAWVEAALEAATFLPELPEDATTPRVVITPLARAVGRSFGHVVMPGADEFGLGTVAVPAGLVPLALAELFALPTPASRRQRQRQAWAQLMRNPALSILRRRADAGVAVAASPDLEWLWLQWVGVPGSERFAAGDRPWQPASAARPSTPVARPLPSAPQALPLVLSATRAEALRACPYRFFAISVLGLEEAEELAEPISKRDFGNWLHALLHAFHQRRLREGLSPARDAAWLREASDAAAAELGLDEAQLLPYRASFEAFAPAYLRWLVQREAEGWRFVDGEATFEIEPPELAPTRLKGVVDRIDRLFDATAAGSTDGAIEVLDYKAGDRKAQLERVREPLEDTQLCVYTLLTAASGQQPNAAAPLRAAYLALDDAEGPSLVDHAQVERSAAEWLRNFGAEWARLRSGQPMPALGEPPTCDHCEARGLCRRDHWSAPARAPAR